MNGAPGFAANDAGQPGMGISEGVYRQAAEEIEILTTAMIVKVTAAAAHKDQGRPPIRVHQVSPCQSYRLFRGYVVLCGFRLAVLIQLPTPAAAG